jgi:hypothetical protein
MPRRSTAVHAVRPSRAAPAAAPPAAAPPAADPLRSARALGAAVAYGRAARATRASPHTLARLVREAPAVDEAARRACVWAALSAYFGARAAGAGGPRARDAPVRRDSRVPADA